MTLEGTVCSLWQHAVVKSEACVLWGAALQDSGLEMVSLAVPPGWHDLLVRSTTAQTTVSGPGTVFTTSYMNNIYVNTENLKLHSLFCSQSFRKAMYSSFVLWKFVCHLCEDGMFNKCKSDTNEAQENIKLLTERKIYGLHTLSYYKNKNFTHSQAQ